MRRLLVPLFLVILSGVLPLTTRGDEHVYITANINGDVLLPCNCTNINVTLELKWQKDFKLIEHGLKPYQNGRNGNCSLPLKDVKQKDNGKYECRYYKGSIYTIHTVNLTIYIPPNTTPDSFTASPNMHLPIIGIPGLLLLFGLIWIVLRKRRNRKGDNSFDSHSTVV